MQHVCNGFPRTFCAAMCFKYTSILPTCQKFIAGPISLLSLHTPSSQYYVRLTKQSKDWKIACMHNDLVYLLDINILLITRAGSMENATQHTTHTVKCRLPVCNCVNVDFEQQVPANCWEDKCHPIWHKYWYIMKKKAINTSSDINTQLNQKEVYIDS